MRMTIRLPDDLHQKVALDALKKRRNSKEAVITEILRAYYGGGQPLEKQRELLRWHLSPTTAHHILTFREYTKTRWT